MSRYSLSHLPDPVLLRELATLVARDRATTAALLARLAEVDARRLYAPAGHPSMFSYCVHELRLSEDAAYKRIQAARLARRFPVLFEVPGPLRGPGGRPAASERGGPAGPVPDSRERR
ncbi:MAG: hypothetical protein HZC42_02790 [Candidatus Eisenbacteria bacterium]|nr:hypothetical protein [Candidatus Eisenbacteria bacterium]